MQGIGDLKSLLEAAQRMQGELARIKSELGGKTVVGEAGGGMVQCVANGRCELVSLQIDPELLGKTDVADQAMVRDLIVAAVNQALDRARELSEQALAHMAGGFPLNLPGGSFGV